MHHLGKQTMNYCMDHGLSKWSTISTSSVSCCDYKVVRTDSIGDCEVKFITNLGHHSWSQWNVVSTLQSACDKLLGDSLFNAVVIYFLFDYITIKTEMLNINYPITFSILRITYGNMSNSVERSKLIEPSFDSGILSSTYGQSPSSLITLRFTVSFSPTSSLKASVASPLHLWPLGGAPSSLHLIVWKRNIEVKKTLTFPSKYLS